MGIGTGEERQGQGREGSRIPVLHDGRGGIDYGSIHIEEEALKCDGHWGCSVRHPCRSYSFRRTRGEMAADERVP